MCLCKSRQRAGIFVRIHTAEFVQLTDPGAAKKCLQRVSRKQRFSLPDFSHSSEVSHLGA